MLTITALADLHPAFCKAFNSADRAALLSLYLPDAAFFPQPGQPVTGIPAFASALDAFLALQGTLHMRTLYLIQTADTALTSAHWTLNGRAPDGQPVTLEGKSIEVLRLQSNGTWLYAIDHPFGA